MRVLIIDDDVKDVPDIIDVWTLMNHNVTQVQKWQDIHATVVGKQFDAVLIDLMLPAFGLPYHECATGFTTGEYIYKHYIFKLIPNVPFAVFSAALYDLPVFQAAITRLKAYPTFRGHFKKGCDDKDIFEALAK